MADPRWPVKIDIYLGIHFTPEFYILEIADYEILCTDLSLTHEMGIFEGVDYVVSEIRKF